MRVGERTRHPPRQSAAFHPSVKRCPKFRLADEWSSPGTASNPDGVLLPLRRSVSYVKGHIHEAVRGDAVIGGLHRGVKVAVQSRILRDRCVFQCGAVAPAQGHEYSTGEWARHSAASASAPAVATDRGGSSGGDGGSGGGGGGNNGSESGEGPRGLRVQRARRPDAQQARTVLQRRVQGCGSSAARVSVARGHPAVQSKAVQWALVETAAAMSPVEPGTQRQTAPPSRCALPPTVLRLRCLPPPPPLHLLIEGLAPNAIAVQHAWHRTRSIEAKPLWRALPVDLPCHAADTQDDICAAKDLLEEVRVVACLIPAPASFSEDNISRVLVLCRVGVVQGVVAAPRHIGGACVWEAWVPIAHASEQPQDCARGAQK
eukprot:scaffold9525_cov98-Phaeocystis_antarctica.AAC.1